MDTAASIISRLIIPHPSDPALLVTEGRGGAPELPSVVDTTGWFWARVDWLNALVRERYGLTTTVLRCVSSTVDEETRTGTRIYVLDTHPPASVPAGTRWARRDDVARRPLGDAIQQAQVETWLAEAAGAPISPLRAPWARPGWFAEAAGWVERAAAAHGVNQTGPVEQVRAWTISTILTAPTDAGDVYFKASGASFPREAAITAMLAANWPRLLTPVLDVDASRSWLLMHDLAGMRLDRTADVTRWEAALRTYAGVQIEAIGHTDALLAAGCQDRRLAGMHGEIDAALADTVSMAPDHPNRLTDEEIDAVRALAPMLHAAVDRLAAGPIPETLEHGDFHPGNIVDTTDTIRIYDWSDACVAHPFFSLLPFFAYNYPLPETRAAVPRLRTAYLEPWTRYAPMAALLVMAEEARRIAVVQQVMSYRHILETVEPALRWEWPDAIPYFLRMLLRDPTP